MHLSSASPKEGCGGGGGGNRGHMWVNQGLCGNFAMNSNDAPTRGENCVFARLKKRLRGRTKMCVLKSIHYFLFLCVHEIDHLLNNSMNRTVEQLAENSGEKKEMFKELK